MLKVSNGSIGASDGLGHMACAKKVEAQHRRNQPGCVSTFFVKRLITHRKSGDRAIACMPEGWRQPVRKRGVMSAKLFIARTLVALAAVAGLVVHKWTGIHLFLWIGLGCYAVCFLQYTHALWVALSRARRLTADLLVVTVMLVSLFSGQPLSGALVAWFISMGLALSFTVIERTRRKIEALVGEKNKQVRILRKGTLLEIPVEQVREGDVAIVPAGEMIPVDGKIVDGASAIDESVVTGEPYTVFKRAGDNVVSGALSLTSQLQVRAARPGCRGFLYRLAADIEASLQSKSPTQRTADKAAQVFIGAVVLYGLGVFVFSGGLSGEPAAGLTRMAAVTAVACPCAWALAVPTAFAAAIGSLGTRGILVRSGEALEMAGQVENVVLDKTGTVTLGRPVVTKMVALGCEEDELIRIAASVESGFRHPVADAIVSYAASKALQPMAADASRYLPGLGIQSRVDGRKVMIGPSQTMARFKIDTPEPADVDGRTVWIALDGTIAGAVIIQDEMCDDVAGLGDCLRSLGIGSVTLATGDSDAVETKRVAERIGADQYRLGMTPDDKTRLVRELRSRGKTLMAGDGVNDAAAMAAADVGISIGRAKADLAVRSSDIIVLHENALCVPVILQSGKRLVRIIRQNYGWAVVFNITGIALATAGVLSPWLAALLHHASSILVVANAARLTKAVRV